jgi:hypothetical protein
VRPSHPSPVRRRLAFVVGMAGLLGGCQWMDSRPEVTITPAGDLTAQEFLDIQVDAGGAPEVRILVDGRPFGGIYPTGEVIHVDLKPLAEGEHELVARVEQGSSPRSSERRRLVRPITPPPLPIEWTETTDPWSPFTVTFTSQIPMVEARLSVTGQSAEPLPFVEEIAVDRRRVVVSLGATLAELGLVNVRLEASGPGGERGASAALVEMPKEITVRVSNKAADRIAFTVTPQIPVPGAGLYVSERMGPTVHLGDFGPSPWVVEVPDGVLGFGDRFFEFRRTDTTFPRVYINVPEPPGHLVCSVAGEPGTVTPRRCGAVSTPYPVVLKSSGSYPNGTALVSPVSETAWSICPSREAWLNGPGVVSGWVHVTTPTGLDFGERSCSYNTDWEWKAAGQDPVSNDAGPIRGRVLAVSAPTPEDVRLVLLGEPGTAQAGVIRIATRDLGSPLFTVSDQLNPGLATEAAAALGVESAVAWVGDGIPGLVDGLLQTALGEVWSPWSPSPMSPDPARGGTSPVVAAGPGGPNGAAWVEEGADGGQSIQVRLASGVLLPAIQPFQTGNSIRDVTMAASGIRGTGPVIGHVEDYPWPFSGQIFITSAWDGVGSNGHGPEWILLFYEKISTWSATEQLGRAAVSSRSDRYGFVRRLEGGKVASDVFVPVSPGLPERRSLWVTPTASRPTDLLRAGMPADGRNPLVAYSMPGGAGTEIWLDRTILIGTLPTGDVSALALDPDGMAVAWTEADGTIHVRMLTP